jgi:hypothetical protein
MEGMSTVKEIEDAIRSLPQKDRDQLAEDLPGILPELNGDAEWRRIIDDPRPSPALDALAESVDAEFRANPQSFKELTEEEFDRHS